MRFGCRIVAPARPGPEGRSRLHVNETRANTRFGQRSRLSRQVLGRARQHRHAGRRNRTLWRQHRVRRGALRRPPADPRRRHRNPRPRRGNPPRRRPVPLAHASRPCVRPALLPAGARHGRRRRRRRPPCPRLGRPSRAGAQPGHPRRPEPADDRLEGADLFIYDSTCTDGEYPERAGWGHSTWQEGARLAESGGVRTCVAFHYDPGHDDGFMDGVAAALRAARPGSVVAREGLTLCP